MSPVQTLRAFVNQRLAAAAEEIFELFEGTIAEYEEKLQVPPQQKLVDAVSSPGETRGPRADVQQVSLGEDSVPPEQQERGSSLDQEDKKAPPHIKEEQEQLWSSEEGEQLQELEEADIKFLFTSVPVKREEDGEEAHSSQLHQRQTEHMETEADGEDCGGAEPDRNPHTCSKPDTEVETGDSSDPETDDSADWKESSKCQSGLNSLKNDTVPGRDSRCRADEKPFSCSECQKRFGRKCHLTRHMIIHTGEKLFGCSECDKRFLRKDSLKSHMRTHTGETPFRCSICGKRFRLNATLKSHMMTHTEERPFGCSVCEKSFKQSGDLNRHMTIHTGEKWFRCSV